MFFSKLGFFIDCDINSQPKAKELLGRISSAPVNVEFFEIYSWKEYFARDFSEGLDCLFFFISDIESLWLFSKGIFYNPIKPHIFIYIGGSVDKLKLVCHLKRISNIFDFELFLSRDHESGWWISSFQIRKSNIQECLKVNELVAEKKFVSLVFSCLKRPCIDSKILSFFFLNNYSISLFRTRYKHFSQNSGPAVPYRILEGVEGIIDSHRTVAMSDSLEEDELVTKQDIFFDEEFYIQLRSRLESKGQKVLFKNILLQEIDEIIDKVIKNKTNIIHFIDGEHAGFAAIDLRDKMLSNLNKANPYIIITLHQPMEILTEILPIYELNRFDAIQVLSPCQYDGLIKLGVDKRKIYLLPHASPYEIYGEKAINRNIKSTMNSKKINFISVGNWQRDYKTLEAVIRILDKNKYNFHIVASMASLTDNLKSGSFKNVYHYQNISDEQLSELYMNAHALLLPLECATANNAILEALAHGLPIITTDLISTKYYVGECGYYARKGDPESLVEAIKAFEQDIFNYDVLCEASRERSRYLSLKTTLERILKMYQHVLQRKKGFCVSWSMN